MSFEKRAEYHFDFGDETITIAEWPYSVEETGRVDIKGLTVEKIFALQDLDGNEMLSIDTSFLHIVIRAKPGFLDLLWKELKKWRKRERERVK